MYFVGGCGIDTPSPSENDGTWHRREPARRDASGEEAGSAPDLPLLVRRCQATDVVDVFTPIDGEKSSVETPGYGDTEAAQRVAVGAYDDIRWGVC